MITSLVLILSTDTDSLHMDSLQWIVYIRDARHRVRYDCRISPNDISFRQKWRLARVHSHCSNGNWLSQKSWKNWSNPLPWHSKVKITPLQTDWQTELTSGVEIDHNFSRAHQIVTTSIIPVVQKYAEHSKEVWEGSKVFFFSAFISSSRI